MSNPFENSRCSEILDSAIAYAGGAEKINSDKTLPLDARIIVILTLKMQIVSMLDPAIPPATQIEAPNLLHRGFCSLVPELYTKAGQARYATLAEIFIRDMKDMKNGKL